MSDAEEIITGIWGCNACGGTGYHAEAECCGNMSPHGDCCGMPVPVPAPCTDCNGGGYLGGPMTRKEAEDNGLHIVEDE
jgi:hypothetical protein